MREDSFAVEAFTDSENGYVNALPGFSQMMIITQKGVKPVAHHLFIAFKMKTQYVEVFF